MAELNCWEFMECGREPGGARVSELGICPVPADIRSDSINGGSFGGRICWAVTGTFCGGEVQGTFAQKQSSCMNCSFFGLVQREQGPNGFMLLKPGQRYTLRAGILRE